MGVFTKIKKFLSEVIIELKKVTWPSRKEVYSTTIVVLITVFIFAIFLYLVDISLLYLVREVFAIFGRG
ncbi:MAG: preprotein translocase subunit SecE [Acidobacteria bacterium]|nr:preprotein translocase subunit SecE [Acidobacteriota bacterium]